MTMKKEHVWRCVDPRCGHAILLPVNYADPEPRCPCGSPMKKRYSPPRLQALDDSKQMGHFVENFAARK